MDINRNKPIWIGIDPSAYKRLTTQIANKIVLAFLSIKLTEQSQYKPNFFASSQHYGKNVWLWYIHFDT